jgi:hypothetical protein
VIPIFVPYVNRPDLLKRAVESVPLSDKWQVEVINNSGKPLPEDIYAGDINPPVPLTFAQTQNWMLKLASRWIYKDQAVPFYLFMHSDAEAAPGTVEGLELMARSLTANQYKWGVIFTAYDALAAFNTAAFREVGGWDTFLEWYCSDNDMYRRLRLAGYECIDSGLPVKHMPSQTLNADPEVARRVNLMYPCREAYYAAKWGGSPGNETFLMPFNQFG